MIDGPVAGGLLGGWETWMRAAGMSPRTIDDRIQLVARFEQTAACDSLAVGWQAVAEFISNPAYSPGTRQTYYAHLHAWFKWLALMDHRIDDPMVKLRSPKRPAGTPRPLTIEQVSRLLTTRAHRRTYVMVLLGAYEGFRVSEIARVQGTDLRGDLIRVRGKGGRIDNVPLHELVAEAAQTMPRTGFWFPSQVGLGSIRSQSVSEIISGLMRRAGVPGTPHALRHFFGTETLKATGDLAVVQQLMRHANIATTVIYTKVENSKRHAAVAALPRPIAA